MYHKYLSFYTINWQKYEKYYFSGLRLKKHRKMNMDGVVTKGLAFSSKSLKNWLGV